MQNEILEFYMPTRIVMGCGSVRNIAKELASLKVNKILIVTDPGLEKAGVLEIVKQELKSADYPFILFSGVEPNPSAAIMAQAHKDYEAEKCQGILAIGGGSSIDTAKAVSILATNGGKIQDYIGINIYKNPPAPLVVIPTTAGTGSEVTWVLVVNLKELKKKTGLAGSNLYPRVAILDPELLKSLPPWVMASTGMDALSHAIEGYVSTRANPITDALHRHAISLVSKNLRAAVANPQNMGAGGNMLIASTIAGMGFTNSNCALVHAMSHPVSGHFGVSHGDVNAILLPHVMRFSWIAAVDKYADIAGLLGGQQGTPITEMARHSADVVATLARDVGIPSGLAEVGADPKEIEVLAREALEQIPARFNPRIASFEEVVEIFKRAM